METILLNNNVTKVDDIKFSYNSEDGFSGDCCIDGEAIAGDEVEINFNNKTFEAVVTIVQICPTRNKKDMQNPCYISFMCEKGILKIANQR